MKDIFIDNNIASRFKNPADEEYKKLIKWLITYTEDEENQDKNAYLVVSPKLLAEYHRSNLHVKDGQNIIVIIGILQRQGRLVIISNEQIKTFKQQYFTKKIEKNLQSNHEDREHIPVVLLSERKYALSIDQNFVKDLNSFPGFNAFACSRPEDMPYNM
jgi:hypothetical protein